MMRSLAARLGAIEQLTALAVVVAFAISALAVTARVLDGSREAFLRRTAHELSARLDDEIQETGDLATAARTVLEEGLASGVRVEIFDRAGTRVAGSPASTASPGAPASRHPSRPGVLRPRVTTAMAVTSISRPDGVMLRVGMPKTLWDEGLSALGRSLLFAAIPILAVSLLLGHIVMRRALRPLGIMAARASAVSLEEGAPTLGARSGLEELDRLADSFDRLLGKLDDALRSERRLTADVSHELRTPLTVLGGELELARAEAEARGADTLVASLDRARDELRVMRDLVEAVLLLHRSAPGGASRDLDFEPVNVCDLAREVVADARSRHPERAADLCVEAPDEILVRGHATLLAAGLKNLVDNAIKFAGRGVVRVAVGETADAAVIRVDDAGPGIPPSERDRVFDPFFRGTEARAGVAGFGLGLPIIRRVARRHGGEVTAGDSPLGGARLELSLPVLAVAHASGAGAPAPEAAPAPEPAPLR